MASFCAAAAALPCAIISSQSFAVRNGNSPIDFVHTGSLARETLEGKLTGDQLKKIFSLFG